MNTLPQPKELGKLLNMIFSIKGSDEKLVVMCDVPRNKGEDTPKWKWLREAAVHFARCISDPESGLKIDSYFASYTATGSNNADLPQTCNLISGKDLKVDTPLEKINGKEVSIKDILDENTLVMAPTRFSATAPLKVLAKEKRFRGVTMPGFTKEMLPAMHIDYNRVHERVMKFKEILDHAERILVSFSCKGKIFDCTFDLRYRSSHPSSGLQPESGMVGNFPSGETYIVPYEGEKEGDPSLTSGVLPVQFGDEIVLFKIENNRAVSVISEGTESYRQAEMLQKEPAYGNISEVGLGVLDGFGLSAVGSTLLDEKLGLHIAFGRSDHFGGTVGPDDFKDRDNVVHIDWIYVPSIQPSVTVHRAEVSGPEGTLILMEDGKYVI